MNPGGKKTLSMGYFRHMDPAKVETHFLCDADSETVPEDEIRALGGKVHYVAPYQRPLANVADIERVCRDERIDIAHCYNSTMNVLSLCASKRAGVPVRISESLSMANEREPKTVLKLFLRRFSKLFATHYMSCGEDCGRWQFGDSLFDSGNVEVFKTAIDTASKAYNQSLRDEVRRELGLGDALTVGFIGRFAAQKNPLFLIEVFSEVVRLRPSARLLLVGDGPYKDEMLAKIDALEIGGNVLYLGRREDIDGLYMAMDCFLLPSLYEGLPVVGLDAQCAGLPVFFSDTITREAAFCELGHFVPREASKAEWARTIIEGVESVGERRAHNIECTKAGYDLKAESKRLTAYYEAALAEVGR